MWTKFKGKDKGQAVLTSESKNTAVGISKLGDGGSKAPGSSDKEKEGAGLYKAFTRDKENTKSTLHACIRFIIIIISLFSKPSLLFFFFLPL